MKIKLLLLITLNVLLHVFVTAQDVQFTIKASATKIGVQNQFQLVITLSNSGNADKFQLPDLSAFTIVNGPMQSSSFSSFNGNRTSSRSFTYYLQPKGIGTYNIPSATAIINGKSIKSNTVKIEVVKGSIQNAEPQEESNFFDNIFGPQSVPQTPNNTPNKKDKKDKKVLPSTPPPNSIFGEADMKGKIFARVDINKTTAYVGEEVTAEYNIYTQLPMEAAIRKPTSPEGFWVQEYNEVSNEQNNERVQINGKLYRKFTLRKVALFATKAGALTIPSVDIEGAIELVRQDPVNPEDNSIGGIINSMFNVQAVEKIPISLTTPILTVTAKPLPTEGQPANFNGTVGTYSLESNIDRTELTTDDAAVLTYCIRGTGNIKLINKPSISFTGDIEAYEPTSFDTITNFLNDISGYKSYKYILQPRNAGELHIPAGTFCYFDLNTKTYQTLSTNEYTLKVKTGTNKNTITKLKGLPQDIHDIVSDDTMKKNVQAYLPEQPLYWAGYAMPLLALLGASIYKKKKDAVASNPKEATQKNAHVIAQQRLSIAHEMLKDENANGFYNETNKAIWLYISDKLNIPLSKLNKTETHQYLLNSNVSIATTNLVMDTAQQCEQALYSMQTNASNMQGIYNNAVQIISELEEQIA
jgi:BatD DUF11 like domain